ncbi:MAG: electron transfer flavoprotein subunit alpha/FixB family protein [Spirochaetes bacterium]|nr:electron transfer flavoprotein subunit alpha/FixB family protein [Spirochaetota bacterium]
MGGRGIWVVCEAGRDGIFLPSLELIAKARSIADPNAEISAVFFRQPPDGPGAFGSAGASRVLILEGKVPHGRVAAGDVVDDAYYAGLLAGAIRIEAPSVVLMAATVFGRAVMPRTAAVLGTGLTADCSDLELGPDGVLVQTRPAYGSNLIARVLCPTARPQMATVRPGVFPAPLHSSLSAGSAGRMVPEIVRMSFDLPDAGLVRLLSRMPVEAAGLDLAGAKVVVAGGMGVRSKEGFFPLERLAGLLGGAVGASRSAVDAGFAPYSRQVGQTGLTVKPDLYLAFGISGSVQHLAGMSNSAHIIAVNADPEAPIFGQADLGIVGDAVKTAEAMIKILEKSNLPAEF